MHHLQERLASGDIEGVKATLDAIEQHESMSAGPMPCHALVIHLDRAGFTNGLALTIDRYDRRGNGRASFRTLQHASSLHVTGDAFERLSSKHGVFRDEVGLHVRTGEAKLVIE